MDVLALLISIAAILISIVIAVIDHNRDYAITQTNLEHDYYKVIFRKHLLYGIPSARRFIILTNDRHIMHTAKLVRELNAMRRDSLFFLYHNRAFYDSLKTKLQDLEDYLVITDGKYLDVGEESSFYDTLEAKLSEIYTEISNASCGKNGHSST